jgi:hypothetical protein
VIDTADPDLQASHQSLAAAAVLDVADRALVVLQRVESAPTAAAGSPAGIVLAEA